MINIGGLISGGGTNLQAIIDACETKKIDGKVVFVGSDRARVQGLERAKNHGIPRFVVNYAEEFSKLKKISFLELLRKGVPADFNYPDTTSKQRIIPVDDFEAWKLAARAVIEAKLLKQIVQYQYDLLVLAGFMRNLTPYFIDRVNLDPEQPRIMNIHPALLPAFPGTDGYGDTFAYGCKVGGCTVHFVDYGEDSGPIIGQRIYPIFPDDTLDKIKTRGLAEEWQLYSECIQLFAQKRLKVVTRKLAGKKFRKVVEILP